MKKILTIVLIVLAIAMVANAEDKTNRWNFTLSVIGDSRYIFYGIDFAGKNDAAAVTLGITATKGKFNAFGYAVSSNSYFEWGGMFDYSIGTGPISLKSVVYPFGWTTHKTYWGVVFIEEATINNLFAPITAIWSVTWIPHEDFKDFNGHYFYLGITKEIFSGIKLQLGTNYNLHYFAPGRGFGGIAGITKSVEFSECIALDAYFKYFINASRVNTDEQVVGVTLLIKL